MHTTRPTDALQLPSPNTKSKTILLVDDDPDIRSLTRTFLDQEGYCVHSCGDSQRATQVFHTASHIDLLITDFYMPQTSGMELANKLKKERHDLPVLLISGGFVGSEHLKQLQANGWNFLGKPFELTELLSTVHLILGAATAA